MATVISEEKKREFVNTEFHQYFNISLKSAKAFYQGFRHEIPISKYLSSSIESILNRYDYYDLSDEEYDRLQVVECVRVIDGDTIVLKDGRTVRLVGVNTPEKGVQGYNTSKKFVEKLCLNSGRIHGHFDNEEEANEANNTIEQMLINGASMEEIADALGLTIDNTNVELQLRIDSEKNFDKYGRVLGVIYVDGKNLNEMLLKEGLAEIMYIPPSEFDPYSWAPEASESDYNESLLAKNLKNQFINVVIPFKEICGDDYGIGDLAKYLNNDFSNIIVTNAKNFNILYKCESYKKTLFIRIEPINISEEKTIDITVHLLPRRYDGTDNILIFKDDYYFLNAKNLTLEENFTERFYKKNRFFETDKNGEFILDNYQEKIPTKILNSYFQSGLNGQNRTDRFHINDDDYPEFDKFDRNPVFYQDYNQLNEWIRETWTKPYDSNQEMCAEFFCDIKKFTGNMRNLQIDACYTYNDSTSTNALHYLGCKDITNYDMADRCVLIDANLDNILQRNGPTNYISQMEYVDEKPHFPITTNTVQRDNNYVHKHTNNIGEKHYKTIKYFNDRLYSEEKSITDDNEVVNHGYTVGDWIDLSQ